MNILNLRAPAGAAIINGSSTYPSLHGIASFRQTDRGVLVSIEVGGLPQGNECRTGIFALHIHEGAPCTGNEDDPFADAKTHYVGSKNCPHPYHAGDLPPLFSNKGYAFMSVLTDRFSVKDIIGRTIIIHSAPDDFTTQPSGNSGVKIGCGLIEAK